LYKLEKQGTVIKDTASEKPRWKYAAVGHADHVHSVVERKETPLLNQTPRTAGNPTANPKGRVLELFGEAAKFSDPRQEGMHFLATAQIGELSPFTGDPALDKKGAERNAANTVLRYFEEHPDLLPKDAEDDFKSALQKECGLIPSYDVSRAKSGGFVCTVTVGSDSFKTSQVGRRRADAEHFAAKLAREKLDLKRLREEASGRAGAVPADAAPVVAEVDQALQAEALREQCAEHDKLKKLLQGKTTNFDKVRGNLSQCIKEARKCGLIDEVEEKRLQKINSRGNCAKHFPESLQPKPAQNDATSMTTGHGYPATKQADMGSQNCTKLDDLD